MAEHPARADLVIRNAKIITVDPQFSIAEALAIQGEKIIVVGSEKVVAPLVGPSTRILDAKGKTILPGLYDSHVHSYRAAVSEFGAPMPVLNSLAQAFQYIRRQAVEQSPGSWIILERVYPTRIAERRTEFAAIDLFRDLARSRELTVRVNCTRMMEPVPKSLGEAIKKLDELTHGLDGAGHYGPTGTGDDWVRIGPLKVLLD